MDDLITGIFRLVGRLLVEVVLEILLKMPGYAIVRIYTKKEDADPDGWESVVWGIVFWIFVGFLAWYVMGKGN